MSTSRTGVSSTKTVSDDEVRPRSRAAGLSELYYRAYFDLNGLSDPAHCPDEVLTRADRDERTVMTASSAVLRPDSPAEFATDSLLEGRVSSEPVSEMGFSGRGN
jgi:hypothetical protein